MKPNKIARSAPTEQAHLASPRAHTEHLLPTGLSLLGSGSLFRFRPGVLSSAPSPVAAPIPRLGAGETWISAEETPTIAPCRTMAAADSDSAISTSTCPHCQREIPSSNIALHSAHCARNLHKCEHCGDMVPRKLMDEHYDENHAPMNCSLCKHTVERELWDLHTGIQCPQRMLACQYCQFELPAVDLFEHQDVCGNRTEYCQSCRKYIRLREWIGHELQFHTILNAASELSSDRTPAAAAAAEQPVPKPARPATGSLHKQLLLTVAITGVAVLIGSILYQSKGKQFWGIVI